MSIFFGNVIYIIHVDKNFLFHKIYLILKIVQNLLITDEHRGSQRVKQSTINKARHLTLTFIIKDYFKIFKPMYQSNGGFFILLATTRTKSCLNGLNILARLMISYREPSINRGFITG